MRAKTLTIGLFTIVFLSLFGCKDKPKEKAGSSEKTPDNFVKASDPEKEETIPKDATEYKIMPKQSSVHWQARRENDSFYKGTIKVNRGAVLVKNNKIAAAKIALHMGSLRVENVDKKDRRLLQAKINGMITGKEGWGFSVSEYPFSAIRLIEQYEKDGQTMFTTDLTFKGTIKTVEIPGNVKIGDKTVTITLNPFSIDRESWFVLFDPNDLMGKYMAFDMEFKAKERE